VSPPLSLAYFFLNASLFLLARSESIIILAAVRKRRACWTHLHLDFSVYVHLQSLDFLLLTHQSSQLTTKEETMKFRPMNDRVLVERLEEEEKTKGGIIIPDSAKEKPLEGKIIAVGSGKRLDDGRLQALDVKANDRILFGKYSGTEIKLEGKDYLILREEDILAVIEK